MKKALAILLCAVFALSMFTGCNQKTETVKIGVVQLMDHPSLDTIRDSFTAQMKELGYVDGENCEIEYKSAGNDPTTQNSIAQSFAADKKDVVVAITTPTAQAVAGVIGEIPMVFSAVSYPIEAGLVESLEKPGGTITGTSDEIQVELILDLALKYDPDMKKLGVIYNAGEANSVTNLAKAQAYCDAHEIELITTTVANTNEVQAAAQSLCSKVDAIFAPNDNTVATAMPALADAAIKAKVPVYTGADSMVNDGGFATIGINYENLGKETANMVDQILKGTKAGDIPVKVFKEDLEEIYNEETAAQLGITIQK
jgi:putative ABC transport system substrate-binding protein